MTIFSISAIVIWCKLPTAQGMLVADIVNVACTPSTYLIDTKNSGS